MGIPIITISGTSGAGKTYLIERIKERYPYLREIAGVTTRPKRNSEIEGISSHFLTIEEFNKLDKEHKLILVKQFFGNNYAWYKSDLINSSEPRIMNISYKSIAELKQSGLDIFAIFIKPESEEKLKKMLSNRTASVSEYTKRIKDYKESETFLITSGFYFDYIYTNSYDEKSIQNMFNVLDNYFKEHNFSIDSQIHAILSNIELYDIIYDFANRMLKECLRGDFSRG